MCVCARYRIAHRWSYRKTKYTVTLRIFRRRLLQKFFFDIVTSRWRHFLKKYIFWAKKSCSISNQRSLKNKIFDDFEIFLFCPILRIWRHNSVKSKNSYFLRKIYVQYVKSKVFLRWNIFRLQNFHNQSVWRHN